MGYSIILERHKGVEVDDAGMYPPWGVEPFAVISRTPYDFVKIFEANSKKFIGSLPLDKIKEIFLEIPDPGFSLRLRVTQVGGMYANKNDRSSTYDTLQSFMMDCHDVHQRK